MLFLLLAALQASTTAIDASALKVSAPTTVAELDLGKLKGELRQIAWSPDGAELYIQTADGDSNNEKLHHYSVPSTGGAPKGLDKAPEWATTYWTFKSDRFAPGIASIAIEMAQKAENTKVGTGTSRPGSNGAGGGGFDVERSAEGQSQNIVRLTLFGENVSEFVNERPIPGLMFSWGPLASGAIAYTDREGQLWLLDQHKRKQRVAVAKEATLPAWSTDGTRLAWAQKSGRKKYILVAASVAR
jgi:hypothetical protein